MLKAGSFIFWILALCVSGSNAQTRIAPLIVDHTCTDISQIPDEYISSVKQNIKVYYGHASHGAQLICGLERLMVEDEKYTFASDYYLPDLDNTLCVFDIYNDPDMFFSMVQDILSDNPSITVAMFAWCGEASWYDINQYTTQMSALEQSNPRVTFVYMTGHAQERFTPGYGRYLFNEALRNYCRVNNKVLFDFADLDVWFEGQYTPEIYDWDDYGRLPEVKGIPLQHPDYNGDDCGHVNFASCENKAKALWWMLAVMRGWEPGGVTQLHESDFITPVGFEIYQNNPNPFHEQTSFTFDLPVLSPVTIIIYNIRGQKVKTLISNEQAIGIMTLEWNATDEQGTRVPRGIYFYRIQAMNYSVVRKMLVL